MVKAKRHILFGRGKKENCKFGTWKQIPELTKVLLLID